MRQEESAREGRGCRCLCLLPSGPPSSFLVSLLPPLLQHRGMQINIDLESFQKIKKNEAKEGNEKVSKQKKMTEKGQSDPLI